MSRPRFVDRLREGRAQHLVTYGTSLTAERTWRFWRRTGGAWVTLLRRRLETDYPGLATVTNGARWGADSNWGVRNLDTRVIRRSPDVVFVEFAINDADAGRGISPETSRANLETMIERVRGARPACEIVLLTMSPAAGRHLDDRPAIDAYYRVYRDVSAERGTGLIDLAEPWRRALTDGSAVREFLPDGIHPGEAAAERIILPGILAALGLP